MTELPVPDTIAHYRVLHPLGAGGMGIVVAANDERLGRRVALKLVRGDGSPQDQARLWREARAAAAVRHPAICQVFEIGDDAEQMFIAMEWLEGETLAERLQRGALPVGEAMDHALALLDALAAIHAEGLLHRDLKPSNIMLTQHGLKVLDFGLARPVGPGADVTATTPVTQAGMLVGTPGYMPPEVLAGEAADARADIFASGAILFEMLAGRAAFTGGTPLAVAHAVLHEQPPALTGAPAIAAADRVLRQALAKDADKRFPSAREFAAALRGIQRPDSAAVVTVRAARRLIVLPFRALRADEDTEFLCAALPESVSATLSQLDSIVVRSSLAAARFGPAPDLQRLASDADVDVALTGTLFRAGEQVRVNAQLVELPGGTLLHSCTLQASARSIFELHDAIVQQLVSALTPHLTPHEHARLRRDVPASHTAYELFLRANELARDRRRLPEAIERFHESLAIDSGYAPAWAQLGRLHRLRSKYEAAPALHLQLAGEAFERALALNPELDVAHAYYAQLEADSGRPREAMVRLLRRAAVRDAAPEIYAGLVYACRFTGLSAESVTFHHEARRLDPGVATSVTQTYYQSGEYLRCVETAGGDLGYIVPIALDALGDRVGALSHLRARVGQCPSGGSRLLLQSLLATFEQDRDRCAALVTEFVQTGYVGCEVEMYLARQLVAVGAPDDGLRLLENAVDNGFTNAAFLARDSWLDPVRQDAAFIAMLERAQQACAQARATFRAAGGDALLAKSHDDAQA